MGSVNNIPFHLYLSRFMDVRLFELLIRVIRLFIENRVRDIRFCVCIKATTWGAVQTTGAGIWNRYRVRDTYGGWGGGQTRGGRSRHVTALFVCLLR